WNQNVCGDAFASQRFKDEGRLVAVLSDGLGSGVKANILATMTARMALKFAVAGSDLLHYSEVMMEALPVCQVRKISYATFSIVDCDQEGTIRVVEEGNPEFIHLRGSSPQKVPYHAVASKLFPERRMRVADMALATGDRLVFCSDGVTQAGMGSPGRRLGWRNEGLEEYLAWTLAKSPSISSRELSRSVVEEAIRQEPACLPMDDASCLALYFRQPRRLMVMTGPPYDENHDAECAARLDAFPGRKVICGGSTAELAARELGRQLEMVAESFTSRSGIPPYFNMDGMDLVTEGILTLTRVARNLEDAAPAPAPDAAGRLLELLLDSDSITFMVGTRINEAHQDPTLPADLDIRRNVVKRIALALGERHLKEVETVFV
ncbi:MAG: serine/threonine-protein phosphatase, partial [Planctomycetota bacterium]|nr:serine/threonine-protein phosphatase [Planctomycetota bacterium]